MPEKPDPKSESQDGSRPDDPRDSPEPARLVSGDDPPDQEKGKPPVRDTIVDRWGDLPVNARDVFRAQGGPDLPMHYREWIDAYFKRLSRESLR